MQRLVVVIINSIQQSPSQMLMLLVTEYRRVVGLSGS